VPALLLTFHPPAASRHPPVPTRCRQRAGRAAPASWQAAARGAYRVGV